MNDQYERERADLIEDLETAQASPQERMRALKEHRQTKGLTGNLMRSAFSLEGALKIIEWVCDPEDLEGIKSGTPEETVRLALTLLGFEDTDEESSAEKKGVTKTEE